VRHQEKRHHTVIETGVYGVVRHPLYAGGVLIWVGMSLWLQSYAAAAASDELSATQRRARDGFSAPARHRRQGASCRGTAACRAARDGRIVSSTAFGTGKVRSERRPKDADSTSIGSWAVRHRQRAYRTLVTSKQARKFLEQVVRDCSDVALVHRRLSLRGALRPLRAGPVRH
jgi:hypothetical protein